MRYLQKIQKQNLLILKVGGKKLKLEKFLGNKTYAFLISSTLSVRKKWKKVHQLRKMGALSNCRTMGLILGPLAILGIFLPRL